MTQYATYYTHNNKFYIFLADISVHLPIFFITKIQKNKNKKINLQAGDMSKFENDHKSLRETQLVVFLKGLP